MLRLYNSDGSEASLQEIEYLETLSSISIEYGRTEGASYYLARIPKYSINGKKIVPKVAITSADGAIEGKKTSTLDYAKRENTIFTLNAGLFDMSTNTPLGQTIINGIVITNMPMTDDNGTAISENECYPLCINEDGDLFAPYKRNVDADYMVSAGVTNAVTAWGKFIDNFQKCDSTVFDEIVHSGPYIRQAIGQYQNGDYFVCTVDKTVGKIENEAGLIYDDLADLLISKGIKFAYSLDGGGSCETVIGQRQINPIYEGSTGRAIPTVIYFDIIDEPEIDMNNKPIYWIKGYSAFGTYNNRPGLNSNYPNRISAYQDNTYMPFSVNGKAEGTPLGATAQISGPIVVPVGATKLTVKVPSDLIHGVIFQSCDKTSTTIINDYGWNGYEFTYELVNYPGTTHITVNVKNSDNTEIAYDGNFSDFSVTFE